MSSIWHTKKEKAKEDKTIFAQHKSFRDGCIECFMWEKQEFTDAIRKDVIAWTYLDDLLALETDLERTRKKLDIAMDGLKRIEKLTKPSYKNRNLEALALAVNTFSGEIIEQISQRNNNG